MNLYSYLIHLYQTFINLFPAPIHWLITLIILVGLTVGFIALVASSWIFLLLLIILLPVLIPILTSFFHELYSFFLYLLHGLNSQVPKG